MYNYIETIPSKKKKNCIETIEFYDIKDIKIRVHLMSIKESVLRTYWMLRWWWWWGGGGGGSFDIVKRRVIDIPEAWFVTLQTPGLASHENGTLTSV